MMTTLSVKAGIVLKGLQEPDCLLGVRLVTGAVLELRAGCLMDIPVWLMAESVGKSVSVSAETAISVVAKTSG